jgi:hypothetical protein
VAEHLEAGDAAVAQARRRAEAFATTWQPACPAGVECLLADFALLTAHLGHPRVHWPRIGHTNLIEPTFGETRRRVTVIARLPGERCARSLVWAVLDRAAAGWRGITYTPADYRPSEATSTSPATNPRKNLTATATPTWQPPSPHSRALQPRPAPLLHQSQDATALYPASPGQERGIATAGGPRGTPG